MMKTFFVAGLLVLGGACSAAVAQAAAIKPLATEGESAPIHAGVHGENVIAVAVRGPTPFPRPPGAPPTGGGGGSSGPGSGAGPSGGPGSGTSGGGGAGSGGSIGRKLIGPSKYR